MEDLFSQTKVSPPRKMPKPSRAKSGMALTRSAQTLSWFGKSKSAPTVDLMTADILSKSLSELSTSSFPRSQSVGSFGTMSDVVGNFVTFGGPCAGTRAAVEEVNCLFQYITWTDEHREWCPIVHEKSFLTYDQIWKILSLSDYLAAAGLHRDSFDCFFSCFRTILLADSTTGALESIVTSLPSPLSPAWATQRLAEILESADNFQIIFRSVLGCIRVSVTLEEAICTLNLVSLLMNAVRQSTRYDRIIIQLLSHYYYEISNIGSDLSETAAFEFQDYMPDDATPEFSISNLPVGIKDREILFYTVKQRMDFDFPADPMSVEAGFPEMFHVKAARQFVGSAFIRERTIELIEWCSRVIHKHERWINTELELVQLAGYDLEACPEITSQVLLWCCVAERILHTGCFALDESLFASSAVSRFGLAVPDAIAIILHVPFEKSGPEEAMSPSLGCNFATSSPTTWCVKRLQAFATSHGVSEISSRYFDRVTSFHLRRWPIHSSTAIGLGRKYSRAILHNDRRQMPGFSQSSTFWESKRESPLGGEALDTSMPGQESLVGETHTCHRIPDLDPRDLPLGLVGEATTSEERPKFLTRISPSSSPSSGMSSDQKSFRLLAKRLNQGPKHYIKNLETSRESMPMSLTLNESWRFDRVCGMPAPSP